MRGGATRIVRPLSTPPGAKARNRRTASRYAFGSSKSQCTVPAPAAIAASSCGRLRTRTASSGQAAKSPFVTIGRARSPSESLALSGENVPFPTRVRSKADSLGPLGDRSLPCVTTGGSAACPEDSSRNSQRRGCARNASSWTTASRRSRFSSLTGRITSPSSRETIPPSRNGLPPRRPNDSRSVSGVSGRCSAGTSVIWESTRATWPERGSRASNVSNPPACPCASKSTGRWNLGTSPANVPRNRLSSSGSLVFHTRSPGRTRAKSTLPRPKVRAVSAPAARTVYSRPPCSGASGWPASNTTPSPGLSGASGDSMNTWSPRTRRTLPRNTPRFLPKRAWTNCWLSIPRSQPVCSPREKLISSS